MPLRELMSENILDVDFVKLISPVYFIQLILGSNTVVICNNLVTKLNMYQKVYTIFWVAGVSGSFYFLETCYYDYYFMRDKTLFYTLTLMLLVQYITYLFNVLHGYSKSEQTLKLFMGIQKVDCALRRNNLLSMGVVKLYFTVIWICYIILAFGSGFVAYVVYNIENPVYALPFGLAMITVHLDLVLTGTCIYYLAGRLQFLNDVIRGNIFHMKNERGAQKLEGLDEVLVVTVTQAEIGDVVSLKDFTGLLTSILKLFNDISKQSGFQLFNLAVTVFICTFLVIETTVVGLKSKLITMWASVTLTMWVGFYFAQLTIVAFTCDCFAKQVQGTKNLASRALAVYYEDKHEKVRKAVWEMLQLIEFEKPVFSVCNIFTLDIKLPLKLIGVITSNLFNLAVTVFICTFLVIETTVVGLKSKLITIWASVTLTMWVGFYFAQLTIVAFTCDCFAKQVQGTKNLASRALAVYYEDKHEKVRKAVWEMLQLIEFEKPVFSVCNIFTLDIKLPLKLIGVITSNVLVFIQYTSNALNTV